MISSRAVAECVDVLPEDVRVKYSSMRSPVSRLAGHGGRGRAVQFLHRVPLITAWRASGWPDVPGQWLGRIKEASCASGDERSPPPRFDCPIVLTAPALPWKGANFSDGAAMRMGLQRRLTYKTELPGQGFHGMALGKSEWAGRSDKPAALGSRPGWLR
jgi:hypothetical protein